MFDNYRHYFNIDPEYFPQVNKAAIDENPELWKKYYPHETFVKLIKNTVSVLNRQQKLSIWVQGEFGTGKSHSVLTLKKLLDASNEETRAYFERFELDNDLCNKLQALKSGEQKILTVHNYGSSSIRGDHNLVFTMQECIEQALREAGIENKAGNALKSGVINWLSDKYNKSFFDSLIADEYHDLFSGDTTDEIIDKLGKFSDIALTQLMDKIFKVADERNLTVLKLDVKGLGEWIKAVIKENNLKAIVFIWDEFSEYFYNNMRNLTGFQAIAELSSTAPFYLIIVTHLAQHFFNDNDKDAQKIFDRFVKPLCTIELPDNMAFRLIGAAMEKNKDEAVIADWNDTVLDDLIDRTRESRTIVKKQARISDEELMNILPIHPYTALLLKNIATAFDSNQRSMFDFIKNDRGDEIKGFQWFIDNYGPDDDNPLLTIDMLWDFFYEKGKEHLSADIRSILDYYARGSKNLDNDEQRVLKAVLLLQAISQKVGDAVELFIPNQKNIENAFEGSDIDGGDAGKIANKLVNDKILYPKSIGNGQIQYTAMVNVADADAINRFKSKAREKSTSALVNDGQVFESVALNGALNLRYRLKYVAVDNFDSTIRSLLNTEVQFPNDIIAIVSFAKDDGESAVVGKKIAEAVNSRKYDNFVFIDTSLTPLGLDTYEQYIEALANSMYYRGKDNDLANQYEKNANELLKKWKNKIANGEFMVYTSEKNDGDRKTSFDSLTLTLSEINKKRYKNCLEGEYTVIDNMYMANSLKSGVECGVTKNITGTFRSTNQATKLENALKDAWDDERYWETKPYLLISKIKIKVDEIIIESFKSEGRVSIAKIYNVLKDEPFGFMPCNLSAFIIGFVLRDYIDGTYSWSDGLTNDDFTVAKLKEMIDEVIKLQITPNPRYKDKYIVTLTPEQKKFNEATSLAFGIPMSYCTSIPNTRDRIRNKMKEFSFPIWTLKYVLDNDKLTTRNEVLSSLIDCYGGIANSNNMVDNKSDNDIALEIGSICLSNPSAAADLQSLLTFEKCTDGMKNYLKTFDDGKLPLIAEQLADNGQYINVLKAKFDADAANWVWNIETAQKKIREVTLEYEIILESNHVIPKTCKLIDTINEWNDKCKYIRISHSALKPYIGDLSAFIELLFSLKKSGQLLDSQKQLFLELLRTSAVAFNEFYNSQESAFKQVCSHYVEKFNDEEISEIFKLIPANSFAMEKADYFSIVASKVEEYESTQGNKKLKKLWSEKTGTDSPKAWSKKYKMPILCMLPDSEVQAARNAFSAINKVHPDKSSIEKALQYIEKATFFDSLVDKNARDKAFAECIIKNNSVMLTDIDEVKDYLESRLTYDSYDWFGLPEVDKKLQQFAEAKYNEGGYQIALEKIDDMDPSDLKRYLKEMIADNMVLGIEIIKGK